MDPYDVTAAMMSDDEDVDWITRIDSIQENSTQTEKFSVPSTVSEIIIKTGIQFLLGLNFTGCKSVTIQDSVVIYDRLDFTGCELDKDYYLAAMLRLKQHQSQLTMF